MKQTNLTKEDLNNVVRAFRRLNDTVEENSINDDGELASMVWNETLYICEILGIEPDKITD